MKKLMKYEDYIKESSSSPHSYFLPTYEQCRQICDANDNFIFFECKHIVDGYNISIFNSRLAMPDDFLVEEIEIEDDTIVTYNEFINQKILKIYNDDSDLYEIGFKSSDKGIIFFVSKYDMITNFILNSYEEQQFKDEFKKLD